jgi:iron complex outermembrane receptor protein
VASSVRAAFLLLAMGPTAALGAPAPQQGTGPAPVTGQGPTATSLAELSLEDLMNIEVTSVSKSKQRIAEAPAAVTVIHADDIQRSGLREIPEILRLVPGLFVQRGTQFNTWAVASRGLPYDFNNNLLVLQDGRTLYTPIFGGVVWSTVDYPTADLDRLEVVRGPGGTLWGANAVNGVINITSKRADQTQGLLVESRVGMDDSDATVRYGGRIGGGTYYRVYGKGRSFDDLRSAGGVAPRYGMESFSGGFRVDRDRSDADHVTLQGDFFGVDAENSLIQPVFVSPFNAPGNRDHRFRGGNVLGRWTHTVSATSDYSLQAYVDRLAIDSSLQQEHISTFDVDFQHHLQPLDRHDLIYGFSGRLQPFESTPPGTGLSASSPLGITYVANANLYLLSALLQDTVALVPDRLKLTLGSKLEYNNLTRVEAEPSARMMYTPNTVNSIWTGVSRAVRTPGLDNRTFRFPVAIVPNAAGNVTEIIFGGNRNADSEHLLAYEAGYRSQITKAWSVDVAGFVNEHKGLLVAQQQAPVAVSTPVSHLEVLRQDINGADTENYGAEVSSTVQVADNWQLTGSYTRLNSRVVSAEPNTTLAGTYYEGPRNQFQIHSYWRIALGLQLDSSLYRVDSAQSAAVPAYTRLDAAVVWAITQRLRLQVGVQNALDPQHSEFLRRSGPQAEIGRAVYAQMTLR